MRPNELTYATTGKHYFDVTNGEILIGEQERSGYIVSGAAPDDVRDLGSLLRNPDDTIGVQYEQLDTSEWDRETFVRYGRWIREVIEPPRSGTRWLSRRVIANAHELGIGPDEKRIQGEFGKKLSDFFAALHLGRHEVTVRGHFDDWTIDDYLQYLRAVGKDTPPTLPQLNEIAKNDTSRPSVRLMEQKYPNLKFRGLLKLAGYTGGLAVIRSWSEDDYIDWGVRFMEDNDGMYPAAVPAEYFSKRKLGPSTAAIRNNFGSLPEYEKQVAVAYWQKRHAELRRRTAKLTELEAGIYVNAVPPGLILEGASKEAVLEHIVQLKIEVSAGNDSEAVAHAMRAYGKYIVAGEVLPGLDDAVKLEIISAGSDWKLFTKEVMRRGKVQEHEIEYAATVTDFFDDLWQTDSELPSLQLGADYRAYCKQRDARKVARRREARLKSQAEKAPV